MGGTNRATAGRRYRRARRLRSSQRGLVAVIGTLLALLVFFALFGIFLTQYVPLWMTDNESLFTAQASTSFATFKSVIDEQYALGGPQSAGTPFVISSQGIPLIAQPTEGTLIFLPNTCPGAGGTSFYSALSVPAGQYWTPTTNTSTVTNPDGQPITPTYCVFENVSMSVGPGGAKNYGMSLASGTLQLNLPNRYYTPEQFYFEDDGVVQSQSSNYQLMAFPPPLNITYVGGNTTVSTSFLQLYGNSSTVVGQGTEEVYSQLKYSQFLTSNGGGSPFTFTFEIGTQYPCAWVPYLYKLVTQSGLPSTAYKLFAWFGPSGATGYHSVTLTSSYTGSCYSSTGKTTLLAFQLNSVNYAQMYVAGVQVTMGIGST